jgi:hypothetical protein
MPTTSGGQPPAPTGTDQADPVTTPTFLDEALVRFGARVDATDLADLTVPMPHTTERTT